MDHRKTFGHFVVSPLPSQNRKFKTHEVEKILPTRPKRNEFRQNYRTSPIGRMEEAESWEASPSTSWKAATPRSESPPSHPESPEKLEFIQLDLFDIKRRCPPGCKLQEPRSMIDNCTLVNNSDPVPTYCQAKTKPISPSSELDLKVFDHKIVVDGLPQELVEMTMLHKSKLTADESENIKNDFETFRQPNSQKSYVTTAKSGLDCRITAIEKDNFCRILYINNVAIDTLRRSLQQYRSFKGLRAVSKVEKAYSPYKPLIDKEDSYEVFFGEAEDGQRLCKADPAARLWPTAMDNIYQADIVRTDLFLRWNFHPLNGTATVTVRKGDKQNAMAMLQWNNITVYEKGTDHFPETVKPEIDEEDFEVSNFITRRRFSNQHLNSIEDYKNAFEKLFEVNGIIPVKIEFHRKPLTPPTAKEILFKINQRIGRCVINANRWTFSTQPYTDSAWKNFLELHEVPWTVILKKYNPNSKNDREAIVKFEKQDMAEAVTDYISRNIDPRFLQFQEKHRQGTEIVPRYSYEIYLPMEIRTVLDKNIRKMDQDLRNDGNMLDAWVRLRDLPNEILAVEGNSLENMTAVKERLKVLLQGVKVPCNTAKNAQLLYGCGVQWVNYQQKKHAGELVISVDRLNETITFFGPEKVVNQVQYELSRFVDNPHDFTVSGDVQIDFPRFLPVMKSVLDSNGEKKISQLLGGCKIGFDYPNKLVFSGTVHQYNNLKLLLDSTQYNILDRFIEKGLGSKAKEASLAFSECPVCLITYSYDKFCLGCGHSYCLQCLTRMVQVGLKSNELPLRCAFKRCQQPISLNTIMSLLFDEKSFKFKEFFTDRLLPVIKGSTRLAAQRDGLPFCIKADCEGILKKVAEEEDAQIIKCPLCETARCSRCPNQPHPGNTCEEEMVLRTNDTHSIDYFIKSRRGNVKRCPTPHCQALILKDNGCNHMVCTYCKTHFCWECLFWAKSQSEIYKHLQDVHGTTGGEWAHLDVLEEVRAVRQRLFGDRRDIFGFPQMHMFDSDDDDFF